jgi:hypothetical protein
MLIGFGKIIIAGRNFDIGQLFTFIQESKNYKLILPFYDRSNLKFAFFIYVSVYPIQIKIHSASEEQNQKGLRKMDVFPVR